MLYHRCSGASLESISNNASRGMIITALADTEPGLQALRHLNFPFLLAHKFRIISVLSLYKITNFLLIWHCIPYNPMLSHI